MKVECKTISELEDLRKQHLQGKANPQFQYHGIEVGSLFNPGVIYPTPMGKAIMPNLMHAFLYRGQNRDYNSFTPSIYREPRDFDDGLDDDLRLFYRELQLREFELLINRFPRVEIWRQQGFYVWSEAIAQHYGFHTTLLDLTNNFDIALFFACCKYDTIKNSYRPLEASDLLNENEQYGVIYGKFNESIAAMLYEKNIKPIGYQPFMRPNNQCGFVCCLEKADSAVDFDWKVLFKHDLAYSKKIFDEFEGGNKIFIKNDSRLLENEFYSMVDAETYSEEAFLNTAKELGYDNRITTSYYNKLKNKGINIGRAPHTLTRHHIRQIDRGWTFNDFLKQCDIDDLIMLPPIKRPSE